MAFYMEKAQNSTMMDDTCLSIYKQNFTQCFHCLATIYRRYIFQIEIKKRYEMNQDSWKHDYESNTLKVTQYCITQ